MQAESEVLEGMFFSCFPKFLPRLHKYLKQANNIFCDQTLYKNW